MPKRALCRHPAAPVNLPECIPTRYPRDGEQTRRVPLLEAIEIAEEYYAAYARSQVNAAYCRARRQNSPGRRAGLLAPKVRGASEVVA